ncbi:hypothetical protein E2C01_004272 [Portunus trituberculatus]|uniref:Uncharacterized protein n=1 Tax=Portunus trituberculatus TaxID=210409 RepID=A0A5B7CPI0_PORTR|nr:hypothetical protein [Portunus trituberculatus]
MPLKEIEVRGEVVGIAEVHRVIDIAVRAGEDSHAQTLGHVLMSTWQPHLPLPVHIAASPHPPTTLPCSLPKLMHICQKLIRERLRGINVGRCSVCVHLLPLRNTPILTDYEGDAPGVKQGAHPVLRDRNHSDQA